MEQIEANVKQGWAIIDGFPFHRVTIDGRVQTRFRGGKLGDDWRDMRPDTDKRKGKGYKRVCVIYNKVHSREMVHRLVAKYFISNPGNKPQVNHKNGTKSDNRVDNLEWCTARENIKKMLSIGKTQSVIAKEFNVHQMTISKINTGILWRHVT
jgi:hypothetical protein